MQPVICLNKILNTCSVSDWGWTSSDDNIN